MKSNIELRATLNMILARLDASEKHTVDEWRVMEAHLREATAYAKRCVDLRARLNGESPLYLPCDHGGAYGHVCCLRCGRAYRDHGAPADVADAIGVEQSKRHLICPTVPGAAFYSK